MKKHAKKILKITGIVLLSILIILVIIFRNIPYTSTSNLVSDFGYYKTSVSESPSVSNELSLGSLRDEGSSTSDSDSTETTSKVIKTGTLSMVVDDLEKADDAYKNIEEKYL